MKIRLFDKTPRKRYFLVFYIAATKINQTLTAQVNINCYGFPSKQNLIKVIKDLCIEQDIEVKENSIVTTNIIEMSYQDNKLWNMKS